MIGVKSLVGAVQEISTVSLSIVTTKSVGFPGTIESQTSIMSEANEYPTSFHAFISN